MATQQHLSKAPIHEALIDIRVTLPKETRELEHLAALSEKFQDRYPDKKPIKEFQYRINFENPEAEEKTSRQVGFRYTNAESTNVIQATLNGLTVSRLPPYQDWSQLREEAHRVWDIYLDHVQPETITRVSSRYINKLNLPGPPIEFNDYLSYVPVVPKVLPQIVAGFSSRIVVQDAKAQCMAIITQSFQPSPSEIVVILDIDVFREKVFGGGWEAWGTIDTLREFKNLIFFDSITEETVTLYK